MEWTEKQIRYIIQDMTDENPLACRALFTITNVEFTTKIPTMAVTLSKSPVLKINLEFCREHLQSENDVKAVLLHEFLHVLLLHTEKFKTSNRLLNIALDAIINSIIYRYKGMQYADFFVRFYKWEEISFLLRPKLDDDEELEDEWMNVHKKIYQGKYCADDLYELLVYLKDKINKKEARKITLLGNHDEENISDEMKELLDGILKKMDGTSIWNKPWTRGTGEKLNTEELKIIRYKKNKWEQSTLTLLKKCLMPDKKLNNETTTHKVMLPVLSSTDRRSMARFKYSGMIPISKNESTKPAQSQLANIYLDVSGSMSNEIDALISLLYHFRSYIKMPLWVFSDDVVEARFKDGKLEYESTGGTSIGPVFNHLRKNKIGKSLIVSDGYVETMTDLMLKDLRRENINVLVSANGNPQKFMDVKIPYLQLEKL
jgi:predicted metal-dependent peptidase